MKADSYTPADSQVLASIPFIAEFSLECSNGEKPALYADVEGTLIPVTQTLDGSKYQVIGVFVRKLKPVNVLTLPTKRLIFFFFGISIFFPLKCILICSSVADP